MDCLNTREHGDPDRVAHPTRQLPELLRPSDDGVSVLRLNPREHGYSNMSQYLEQLATVLRTAGLSGEFRPFEYDTYVDGLECQVVRRGGHCGAGAELSWQPFLTLATFDPDEVKRIARLLNDAEIDRG